MANPRVSVINLNGRAHDIYDKTALHDSEELISIIEKAVQEALSEDVVTKDEFEDLAEMVRQNAAAILDLQGKEYLTTDDLDEYARIDGDVLTLNASK